MKEIRGVEKEYHCRVRMILKSKLNGGFTAIDKRAVSILRYGAQIISWTNNELQEMNKKTRKLLTLNLCCLERKERKRTIKP